MDEIKIHRKGDDDDLSKYTPDQLREILAARDAEKRRGNRNAWLMLGIILIIAGAVVTPLIARLWSWGFA